MSDATAAADLMFRPVGELAGAGALRRAVGARAGPVLARPHRGARRRAQRVRRRLGRARRWPTADAIGPGDERPFAGVPIAIKNNRGVEGRRLTYGADLFGDFRAPLDHNVVRRLRAAGFVLVGSTTLPEFGILPGDRDRRFGATRNPWDPSRTPGGSSGGSAAAVAAGMVPIAHGNDGGGSIRIPAACCGLVGLKPQRGRISLAPEAGGLFLVVDGVLTRTVSETAQVLDVLAGPELGDAWWAPEPDRPFADQATDVTPPACASRSRRSRRSTRRSTPARSRPPRTPPSCCARLGHEVVEAEAPWGDPSLLRMFTACFGPAVCTQIAFAGMLAGREPAAEDMEPLSWALFQLCKTIDSTSGLLAELQMQAVGRAVVQWTAQFDAVMTPALAEAPVPLGDDRLAERDAARGLRALGAVHALHGHREHHGLARDLAPALRAPGRRRRPGLPLGVQLVGQPAGEGALLALAAQLEAAQPWADRRPPVS